MLSVSRPSLAGRLIDFLGETDEHNRNLDEELKYVLLEPEEVNMARQSGDRAQDKHIYQVTDRDTIKKSCCGKFDLDSEQQAGGREKQSLISRREFADLGRSLCGRCVASLYSNRDTRNQRQS